MRAMKDKQKIILVCKCYLELKGPSTAKELSNFIRTSSIKLPDVSSVKISSLLKKHQGFKRTGDKVKYYEVIK